ncbi:MAG: hypothetical protein J0L87_14020 [Bacteroidetes bacterium]|nr:hypothetical protein [Bacteroidota bacterium]
MNKTIKIVFLALILLPLCINTAKAAGMGMGPPAPCGGPFPPCPVPLDSSIILLLLAGALFGAYKMYISYKKNPA